MPYPILLGALLAIAIALPTRALDEAGTTAADPELSKALDDVKSTQPEIPEAAAPPSDAAGTGAPPARNPTQLDVLELNTGERVRGTIDRVSDGKIYFDSEEFDDIEIDWPKVSKLVSTRMHTYRAQRVGTREDDIVTGTASLVDGVLRVDTGEEIHQFTQKELISMIAGGLEEGDFWSAGLSFGLTARTGNSKQSDLTLAADLKRETALTRADLAYRGGFSSVNGNKTANNHRGTFQFDTYLTRRLYIVLPTAEVFSDKFQNVGLRATAGGGVGYDLIKWPKFFMDVGTGLAYQYTDFDSTGAGQSGTANDVAASFSTTIELDPISNVEWDTSYKLLLVMTDLDNTSHHLESVVSIEVWGPLDLDITAIWDRIESPPPNSNGITPKSNDLRMTVGLGLDF